MTMTSISKIRRLHQLLACACVLALAVLGCGRGDDRARSKQSTVTVLSTEEGIDERSWVTWTISSQFLVFLPLVTWDENGEIEGRLARSWEHSSDYRTWTVHLRTDVRWHDGVPVTAHDIEFTLELWNHLEMQSFSMTVLDDSTYTITYHKGLRMQGSPLDSWTVFYPKHLLENLDPEAFNDWDFWTHPVGNGPYRYVRHVPKTMIEFEANPDFVFGTPKIEHVVIKFGAPGQSLTELLSGNVDVSSYVNPTDLLMLADDPRFEAYYKVSPNAMAAIAWNHRHRLFGDARVRRALTLAIDRRELHRVLNLPEETPIFDGLMTERQMQRGDIPEAVPYDPERAKQLLDEAGWIDVDGMRRREGEAFRFTALTRSDKDLDKAAIYIQAQLRRLGIQMEIRTLESGVVEQRMRAGAFEAAISVFTTFGGRFTALKYFEAIGYTDGRVLALIHEVEATVNPDERDRLCRAVSSILKADLPMTLLSPAVFTFVVHRRIRGLSPPGRVDPLVHMEELWLEDED